MQPLQPNELLAYLGDTAALAGVSLSLWAEEEIDSTSSLCRRLFDAGNKAPLLAVAETQSGGRGRQGKSFFSPRGGVYMTLSLPINAPLAPSLSYTAAAAVAVRRAVFSVIGVPLGIKWVNDLYFDGKKAAGILCEAVADYETATLSHLFIGVGINLGNPAFPADLSAAALPAKEGDREKLIAAVSREILAVLYQNKPYMEEYRRHSTVVGREIFYWENGKKHEARACEIDGAGALVVEENGEKKILSSGEITLRTK